MPINNFSKISLGVGLVDSRAFGYTLLEQSGIPRYLISSIEEGILSGLRLFFWNHDLDSLNLAIAKYPEVSFAVLTTHDFIGKLYGKPVETHLSFRFSYDQNIQYQENSFYLNQNIFTCPGADIGISYTKTGNEIKDSGMLIIEHCNVILISFPWDFLNYQTGGEFGFRPFYSGVLNKNFVEIGPPVDLSKFRRLVINKLIYASDKLGLPLIAMKHPFLNGKFFSIRIDADGFHQDAIFEVLKVSNLTGLKFTWFIDVEGWQNNLNNLKVLKDHQQSIQLHCYEHMTYKSKFLNRVNIRKGLRYLKKHQVEPIAMVSSNGFYPAGYAEAIKDFSFQYTSEFGYDVDNLPSWPGNDKHHPLQIPVHPGSFGVLLPAGFTDINVFTHLYQTIQDRISADGLTIIYEHPFYFLHRTNFWIDFFKGLSNDGYQYISLSDIAKTWKEHVIRLVNLTFDIHSGEILTDSLQTVSSLIQLNNVRTAGSHIKVRKQAMSLYPYNFLLIDPKGVQKEIESRQWILRESKISIPIWFFNYYWNNIKVLIIKSLKKLNLYKKD